ncbi:GAF domain-containing sensor histidine kinase [Actinoplanes sp. NPDC051411]|uniref:GAF domain-containing sensor histidine kinase n=1 Tax=Actinoplanes sp. NPDC051411 TaxID=3155522 RepID=UPI00344804D6
MRAPVPADEPARLAALHDTQVLDTPPEDDFDDIALLAAEICHTPMGMVSLVDRDRQWFKAKVGLDIREAPRELSFCAYAITGAEMLEVRDARDDDRFSDNPYVTADHGLRFYAGAPVVLDGVHSVGTVCVVDNEPRTLTAAQQRALRSLARHASAQLELRRYARHAGEVAERLSELDQMKDTFLVSVSHELRTPLSSIVGYLELLLESLYDADTGRRFLTVMQRNSTRLLRLVEELLLVSRLTETDMDLDLADLDLTELIRSALEGVRAEAEQREVRLTDRSTGPVPARGDVRRLGQALDHLLTNAVKFTGPGGEVVVRAHAGDRPGVTVTDTGMGIADKDLPHVFERFYRGRAAEVMAVPGPGLGLAIVRAIIDAHNGTVRMDSEPGVGTTVDLTLPCA